MSRFEIIGNYTVNVDRIKKMWRDESRKRFYIELDDGRLIEMQDERNFTERTIEGYNHIVQVIPCVKPLCVLYGREGEEYIERTIQYLGLCADGSVRPLEVCEYGLDFADDVNNFVGLHEHEQNEEEGEIEKWEQYIRKSN